MNLRNSAGETTFFDQIMFNTIRISTSSNDGVGGSIGTGFVVAIDLDEDNRAWLLISNKHVYGNPDQDLILHFHVMDQAGSGPGFEHHSIHRSSGFGSGYIEHPNADIDLACLNISAAKHSNPNVLLKHLDLGHFASFEEKDLFPGMPIWFVGYPKNRFDVIHNVPLLRAGVIASLPTLNFNGQPHFVIDAQVYPGSSGSPVFGFVNDEAKLLGVVTQTMISQQRLQPVGLDDEFVVEQIIGLGIVIKASQVLELVKFAQARIRDARRSRGHQT